MTDPTVIGGLVEKIRTGETKAEKEMLVVAFAYRDLREEAGSAKAAAKIAKTERLRYANDRSLARLIAWAELVEAIQEGADSVRLPFTEGQIRPLLSQHFQDEVGPGGLAEIWNELEEQTPKAFIVAANEAHPPPKKKQDQHAKFVKAVKAAQDTKGGWKSALNVPTLFDALGPADDFLTLYMAEAIAAKWGSLTKFQEQASKVRKENIAERAAAVATLKKEGVIT